MRKIVKITVEIHIIGQRDVGEDKESDEEPSDIQGVDLERSLK
jgi:hypothetical protein